MFKCKLRDSTDEKYFVAKVFKPENRFLVQCEVNSLKVLDHPNAVKFVDGFGLKSDNTIDESQQTVVVINYIDGEPIIDLIPKKIKEKTLDKNECLKQMLKMAEVMDYLHSNLYMMHRDLHVGNWMISKEGEPSILDFGTGFKLGNGGYT